MEEVTRVFRVRRTVLQMLVDRGYAVAEHAMKTSLDQFREKWVKEGRKGMRMLTQHLDDMEDRIMVFYSEN